MFLGKLVKSWGQKTPRLKSYRKNYIGGGGKFALPPGPDRVKRPTIMGFWIVEGDMKYLPNFRQPSAYIATFLVWILYRPYIMGFWIVQGDLKNLPNFRQP